MTNTQHAEERYVVIYGYDHKELSKLLDNFRVTLPEYVTMTHITRGRVTTITLYGRHDSVETLRFKINQLRQALISIFKEDVISTENISVAQLLGRLLHERELTVACAESCTGGNVAHSLVEVPGSSAYFLGSVVSYSNDVKAEVLGVSRSDLDEYGAVSEPVVKQMAKGASRLMRSDCAIATSGIAGPDGGTPLKPVGTVWIAVKLTNQLVTECIHFSGNRNEVIEAATNHGMVMLIKMLRNNYIMQEDYNDE